MTYRHIIVRDMIVRRYMNRKDLPNNQALYVQNQYWRFREQKRAEFDYLEGLANDLRDPEFKTRLDRLANEFYEW